MLLTEKGKYPTAAAPATVGVISPRQLLHLLESHKGLYPAALERANQLAKESGERLETVVTRLGLVPEQHLAQLIADELGIPIAARSEAPAAPLFEDCLTADFLKRNLVIPWRDERDGLVLAMVHPLDTAALDAVRFATGRSATRTLLYPADFEAVYEHLYGGQAVIAIETAIAANDSFQDDVERLRDSASEAPVIRLVNQIIARAVEARASDIHIEPMERGLRLRYRIDGVLHAIAPPARELAQAIVSRIKIMAKLDIAEHRLAQDGRIAMAVRGHDIDFRVATTPTVHGESVVLRILDRSQLTLDFDALGFEGALLSAVRTVLAEPHGIVLATGPTGSGKTTTLYTALGELNTPERKILTIEDPVEYKLDGVNQVQVKPQIGLTFPAALRSFLRHDPDVMMIGEIRDLETAQIAVQAALTGHLILSTLHTNDAASAVTRLLDMGVEDYLLTSTVNAVLAQRLVRKLCPYCREAYRPLPELAVRLDLETLAGADDPFLYRAAGCSRCNETGYLGRSVIAELMLLTDAIRQAILKGADAGELARLASEAGMQAMQQHGLKKALAGITSMEEVMRVSRAA